MRSIFELITKYKSDVIIVPVIAFGAFILTLFLYIFLNKRKFIKYIPGLIALVVGLVMFIQGFFELLNTAGLDFIDMGAKFLIFALISILLAIIFDVIDSFARNVKSMVKKDKPRQVYKDDKTIADNSSDLNEISSDDEDLDEDLDDEEIVEDDIDDEEMDDEEFWSVDENQVEEKLEAEESKADVESEEK